MTALRALLLALVLLACGSRGTDDAALAERASQTMKALNAADATFPDQITRAISESSAGLMVGNPGSAAAQIETKVIPLLDSYLATIDRAVVAADAYMANKDDAETKQAIEKIRARGEAFRKARARFVELVQKIRDGATTEEIASKLVNIGMMLGVGA